MNLLVVKPPMQTRANIQASYQSQRRDTSSVSRGTRIIKTSSWIVVFTILFWLLSCIVHRRERYPPAGLSLPRFPACVLKRVSLPVENIHYHSKGIHLNRKEKSSISFGKAVTRRVNIARNSRGVPNEQGPEGFWR
jgi:hypothetical protein